MASPGNRKDPLPVFCFKVDLKLGGGESASAFFKSVSGLKYETAVDYIPEGGANDTQFALVGKTKWGPLLFKQGFVQSSALLKWRDEWLRGQMRRVSGTIIQLNTQLTARATWKFHNGWPSKWELSELDASKSELSIETLEIAHEGLEFMK